MTTILHTHNYPLMRSTIKTLIKGCVPHARVDEAHDGDSTLEKLAQNDYDLILMGISLPGTDSFTLISDILLAKPSIKILIFSRHAEAVYAKKYLQLGAMGYLMKDASIIEIGKAINMVLSGKRYISDALTDIFQEDALTGNPNNPFDRLSRRESEVVQHLFKGETLSYISKLLHLQASTVGTMKSRIFEKLQCTNLISLNLLADVNNVIRV
jgi:two-component system, NarL family, invasion response regulator UvrY